MDAARIRRLFVAALDLTSDERVGMLRREGASAEEEEAVLELLSFDRPPDAGDPLHRPIAELRREAASGRFGVYELLEPIGRGGMGTVFRAERVDGEVRQVVAIKVIEWEFLDPKAVERFRRERQILSGLAHANIARLLDTGTREDGRPYLVMEFIAGETLDEYCRKRNLGIRDKLLLFLPVCRAIEYAHSKLVVHRDLKPSNILVTGEGEPKLLDFGIARALDDGARNTQHTLALTPKFASPDEVRGEPPSTATDVYGLGAVLYYLLTGSAPHRVEGLSAMEVVRYLCESEPQAPSALRPELRGDLENILRKAMHREPERRYGSARQLAEDIENFLEKRPVQATPDSLAYRTGRFIARRRALLGAASLALAAIAAGAITAGIERRRADEEAAIARAVNEFLQQDLLSQAGLRSQVERGAKADPNLKVRTVLERAAASVHEKFQGLPKVEAAIRTAMGSAYGDIGLDAEAGQQYQRAVELYRAAGASASRDALSAANRLGETWRKLGKRQQAEVVFRETLERARGVRDGGKAAAHAQLGLAMAKSAEGKRGEALPLLEEAVGRLRAVEGPENESVLTAVASLAAVHQEAGNAAEAERLFREVLETRRRTLGAAHLDTLVSMNELGIFYGKRGRRKEAAELMKDSADGFEAALGPDHPYTLSALANLGNVYSSRGLYGQAELVSRRVFEGERRLRGPDHPETLAAANNLAVALQLGGKLSAAVELYEETLAAKRKTLGPEHLATINAMRNLGSAQREMGRLDQSAAMIGNAVALSRRVLGEHADTAVALNEFGRTQKALGHHLEAERLFRESLEMRLKLGGPKHQATLVTMNDLAGVLQEAGRHADAESLYLSTLAARRETLGGKHPSTLNTMSDLAGLYRAQRRFDEAAELHGKVLDARRGALGAEHPSTLRSMRDLASVYLDQGRVREALPLLVSVLQTVSTLEREGETIRGLTQESLTREIELLNRRARTARLDVRR